MKRHVTLFSLIVLLALLVVVAGCDKKTDDTQYTTPSDYFRLEMGKYIIYRLDSLTFANYGVDDLVTSYQAKDIVEGIGSDLLGRPTWRVQRYLRPFSSTNEADWKASVAYEVIKDKSTIEINENNLRFIKLQTPIAEGRGFMGNGYLPDEPYNQYDISITENMQSWESSYEEFGPAEINGKTYDNTITITQVNDSSDVPIVSKQLPASKTVWVEKYAKDIGLIYRDVAIWEYQPPLSGSTEGKKIGFGIRLSIISHN
ncbi:hypothetical protein [Paraflavitalea sp. CAU 1676]|uniref:hypothetical protein n=1 Tax=Paraflavitalea sp. CAU 1676 TaxID=3032598 RepID=UPI0023DA086C|nr:hypothetical protein [Paraflavitalea sp. CAU 1676]MDF2189466.1 hypothetical protein [Paraflavitalea sp. CAU 1676]